MLLAVALVVSCVPQASLRAAGDVIAEAERREGLEAIADAPSREAAEIELDRIARRYDRLWRLYDAAVAGRIGYCDLVSEAREIGLEEMPPCP